MKLLRYGPAGQELPGLLDAQGRIRALSPLLRDITPELLSDEALNQLRAIDPEKLPLVAGQPRLGAPVAGTRQFIAVGVNYALHAEEASMAVPKEPIVFNKSITCIGGANDDIVIPPGSKGVDWEVELGFVIGKPAYQVPKARALDYVAGYFTANDVSEREWQLQRGGQFVKGKSPPTFGPVGPWLVTRDEVPDPQNLRLNLQVNGITRQDGSTRDMLFGVAWLIEHLTGFFRLEPGDLVITGTPAGVAYGMKPPVYLQPGDVVTLEVEGLGRQTQRVRGS
ncbi:fumarylacetoacetate hydrolase family protein [Ideonella sp. DXS22W]|uniref:Fumarylacetoacetate hydrolase family protein n=1 Tax=Pseudaquabacterium inlustre TaxID=2984192 RepID=A0ABU9CPJ6_9BURK